MIPFNYVTEKGDSGVCHVVTPPQTEPKASSGLKGAVRLHTMPYVKLFLLIISLCGLF